MRNKKYWIRKISAIALTAALVGTGIPFTTAKAEGAQTEVSVETEEVNAASGNYELMNQLQGATILH